MLKVPEKSAVHWALRLVGLALIVMAAIYVPTQMSIGTVGKFNDAFILIIAAMALNLVLGYTGLISIGHSAFYGIGAYTMGVLVQRYGWGHGMTFFAAAAIAFALGCLLGLPALRIKGIYLALVTLAFAVLFPTMMRWNKLEWLTGGSMGIDSVKYDRLPNIWFLGDLRGREDRAIFAYWFALLVLVISYLVCRGVVKSRMGRAMAAIRDNETAAAAMGVNLARTKTLIFGISAAVCALAGALSTSRTGVVTPESTYLTLLGSIVFLLVMVVGGAGTLTGPVVGGLLYVFLDDYTREQGQAGKGIVGFLFGWADTSPATMILSLVLIVLMFVAPFGLVGLYRRLSRKLVVVVPAPVKSAPPPGPPAYHRDMEASAQGSGDAGNTSEGP